MAAQQADFVNVRGQNFARGNVQVVLHQVDLLESDPQQAADPQNKQRDRCRHQHRNIDVADFVPAAGPVDRGRLIQARIDRGQRGDVNDAVPSDVLPHVRPDIDAAEPSGRADQIGRIPAEQFVQIADQAGARGEQDQHQPDHDDRGDKVRHVRDRLEKPAEPVCPHLIHHQRQYDRNRKRSDAVQADNDGVLNGRRKLIRMEKFLEMLEPHPWTAVNAQRRAVILERDQHAVHRFVREQQRQHHRGQQQQIQSLVSFDSSERPPKPPCAGFHDIPSFSIVCSEARLPSVRRLQRLKYNFAPCAFTGPEPGGNRTFAAGLLRPSAWIPAVDERE